MLVHKGIGRYKGNEEDIKQLLELVDVVVVNMGNEYGGDDLEGYEWCERAYLPCCRFPLGPKATRATRERAAGTRWGRRRAAWF